MAGASRKLFLAAVYAVFLVPVPSLGQIGAEYDPIVPIPEGVKSAAREMVDEGINPCIVLATYDHGEIDVFSYGLSIPARGAEASEETIFEIGSITKTFTGMVMAKLFAEEKIHLWDPLDSFFPSSLGLRDESGTPIQLAHLATHSSGLPNDPDNLLYDDDGSHDPYADYDRDNLYDFLERYDPSDIGESFQYSNLGFAALSEALAIADGKDFQEIVQDDIIDELGLDIFYGDLPSDLEDNLAQGYGYNFQTGEVVETAPWVDRESFSGSGGLRSNILNLLSYGVAALPESENSLRDAFDVAQQAIYSGQGDPWHGLGFYHGRSWMSEKEGGTGGFSSNIVIDRANSRVAAALTNQRFGPVRELTEMLIPYVEYNE